MIKRNLFVGALTSFFVLSTACRNSPKATDADTEAVFTANTPIKSQGQIGFCWAYAAVAMIESDYKKRTGRDLDLSEEAIGFFHFTEQLKANMDYNLKTNSKGLQLQDGGFIHGTSNQVGSKAAFALIERWGLIPESQWSEKFDANVSKSMKSIKSGFDALQQQITGKQTSVQFNQIFPILTKEAFGSLPPVDGFNNGSGTMNAVKYAREVIGFRASNYEDVFIHRGNAQIIDATLERVKKTLAAGNVVGITISMPDEVHAQRRLMGSRFSGYSQPFGLYGAHAMVITDFKNPQGSFGPAADVAAEVEKKLARGFQFRLKNSWGSSTGVNEFGQTVPSGYYDMDMEYITDVLASYYPPEKPRNPGDKPTEPISGFVIFTVPRE
jgi:hypothetical protein